MFEGDEYSSDDDISSQVFNDDLIRGCEYQVPVHAQIHINIDEYISTIYEEYRILDEKSPTKMDAIADYTCRKKNRYSNIIPFEETRVRLQNEHSDYINANYVIEDNNDGGCNVNYKHKYIATQGPLENTVNDFWQMVWQNDTEIIIMVCKLFEQSQMKCYRYWPCDNDVLYLSDGLSISHTATNNISKGIIVRTFSVKKESQHRIINQLQFNDWPDFGIPDSVETFVNFINVYKILQKGTALDGCIVIHCSAGVGRTGTFITIDIGLDYFIHNHKLCNIQSIVEYIRTKRAKMIQTEEQYLYVYKVLVYCILCMYSKGGGSPELMNGSHTSLFETIVRDFIVKSKNEI